MDKRKLIRLIHHRGLDSNKAAIADTNAGASQEK